MSVRLEWARIDVCSQEGGKHEPHSRWSIVWPDSVDRRSRLLWCLGYYDQTRQANRVLIQTVGGVESVIAEVVGFRVNRRP